MISLGLRTFSVYLWGFGSDRTRVWLVKYFAKGPDVAVKDVLSSLFISDMIN